MASREAAATKKTKYEAEAQIADLRGKIAQLKAKLEAEKSIYFQYLTKNSVCSATSSTKTCRRLGPPADGCECIPIQNKGTTRSISTIPSRLLRENKIEWQRREKRPAGKAELPPCFGARSSEVQADMDESAPFQCSKASTIQQACQEFGGVVQKCFDHV